MSKDKSKNNKIHIEGLKAPIIRIGIIQWIRVNLFNGVLNSILTIVMLFLLYKIVPPFIKWAFIDSFWFSTAKECRAGDGACWSIIPANIRFIIFGFYPHELHWRPLLAMIMMVGLLLYCKNRDNWKKSLVYIWISGLFIMGLLMKGGLFGLTSVDSDQWGGLPLTLMLSVFGMVAAYPLGILLALGRRSKMPAVKTVCIIYIELIRGVPLISLLFMSAILFPLFLPQGVTVNKIIRAQAAIIMFTAAYIAEVVRGGLQAITRGQYEAAESLGLNYSQKMRLVILPQALKIVIPPTVGILISAFKDTSLVVIIALYEILKTTRTTLSDPAWMGFSTEAYIFVAMIYFVCCYSMSNYSRRLEKELHS
ncbi:MAG: amino acid ABC transporter permease [Proteobacteria bacterium]|nr:amino acid ABC transporter permease [Pseudomonadota bacterium]